MVVIPSSLDAERGLLSCFLLNPVEVGTLCGERGIVPDHFHFPQTAVVFTELQGMWERHEPIDLITLTQRLIDRSLLQEAGGPAAVSELFTLLPTWTTAPRYAEILQDKRQLRRLMETCADYTRKAAEAEDVPALVAEMEQEVFALNDTASRDRTMKEMAIDSITRFQEAQQRGGRLRGISTGLSALDELTGGIGCEDYVVISAETSGGKTSLALGLVETTSIDGKQPSLVFSYEMSREELTDRLICSRARYNLLDYLKGNMTHNGSRLIEAANNVAAAPIHIRDESDMGIAKIRAIARRLKRKTGLALIVVDYLQLIPSPGKKDNREQEVAAISRQLKAMAKELKTPVVALSQLNDDGKVRESRAIAHDANLLLIIQEEIEEQKKGAPPPEPRHYIKVAKQRNGPRDRVSVTFLKHCTKFVNHHP